MKGTGAKVILCSSLFILCCDDSVDAGRWLVNAKNVKARATGHAETGDVHAAIELMREFVDSERPRGIAAQDERIVIQSMVEFMGRLALEGDKPEVALAYANRCLEEGVGTDVFTARCLTLRGRAYERLNKYRDASDAYLEAQRINVLLLQVLINESDKNGERE